MLETTTTPSPGNWPAVRSRLLALLSIAMILWPYAVLVLISLGSGWTFPRLLPDRLDLAAWRHFVADRDGLAVAIATSATMSLIVATTGTFGGLLVGRSIRRSRSTLWRFMVYLPFVISPVVAAIGLYDMLIRLRLAGTITGVVLTQTLFALSFAAVFFSELWNPRAERLELLVRSLGGNECAVWRHAVLPHAAGLIFICCVETALYSWLDYGLVSVVGGGHVPSVTMKLFAYIREASVNQAGQASLVLLGPVLMGSFLAGCVYLLKLRRADDHLSFWKRSHVQQFDRRAPR